jgi:hypothetical protein
VAAEEFSTDICIYGGTSGGVVAAVQAARLGKTVVIVEPGQHLGGMMSGGLCWTDVGTPDRVTAIGGMAREVYERIGKHYGQEPGSAFIPLTEEEQMRRGIDYSKPPSLAFEPSAAELIFNNLVKEHDIRVFFSSRLQSVEKDGARIVRINTTDGNSFKARIFIDTTYEGDLMAGAGVPSIIGREANAQYNETVNGIQPPARNPRAGKFEVEVDPYRTPGDPDSGLLPLLLNDEPYGEIGEGDHRIQSYNYRVCLTDVPQNRIPIDPPADYDPANYELLARWTEARIAAGEELTLRSYLKYDPLQNGKYDFNNRWPISTDFIGGSEGYADADPARREQIAKAHENYLRGFFHFLATSPRIPENVREEMGRFGLCKDEFTDNHGWPHQIYVREARRMIGDFVMTEHHPRGERTAPDPVGLGAYGIDLHAVRRVVVNGQPVNEGTIGAPVPNPYPIAYGSIVPKQSDCNNLFVTFALSASHVAFGSIRMEPVFMTLSQSATIAACQAIDTDAPVQTIDYDTLREQLIANNVVLEWTPESAAPELP